MIPMDGSGTGGGLAVWGVSVVAGMGVVLEECEQQRSRRKKRLRSPQKQLDLPTQLLWLYFQGLYVKVESKGFL
jgi:hypothetical protein